VLADLLEAALAVATDAEHRFELAVTLKRLDVAHAIAAQTEHPHKWRQLSELALRDWDVDLAVACMAKAEDVSGLLLVHTATGNASALAAVAEQASTSPPHQHTQRTSVAVAGKGGGWMAARHGRGLTQGPARVCLCACMCVYVLRTSLSLCVSLCASIATAGQLNIAFVARLLLGQTDKCMALLSASGRTPEAAFFARTYAPRSGPMLLCACVSVSE
jgi:hypothetical protein